MVRLRQPGLLLGEWACLGALGGGRLHGFAIAKRMAPDGDIGRVWTLSRPLTYRALRTLADMEYVRPVGEEPGRAGPNRTLLALTPKGRAALRRWLAQPVAHTRDVRGELLLKIVVTDLIGADRRTLVQRQIGVFEAQQASRAHEMEVGPAGTLDPVTAWRTEFAEAAARFLRGLAD